jgi:squalene-hopene/tetraprenyl-beta-curcumene cyclase
MAALALPILAAGALALAAPAADTGAPPKQVQVVRAKAVKYLRSAQHKDGGFSPKFGPGVTALVVAAMLRNGYGPDDPLVVKAMKYLETRVHKDGGIYDKRLRNYTTSVALMTFKEANKDGRYDTVIKNAVAFLRKLQNDDPSGKGLTLGGVGYEGKGKGADLSNTHMFLEALLAAGVSKDDPAVKNALKFIRKCQNLPGEDNDLPFAKKAKEKDKGGLTYSPLDPDDSPHATGDGGLRSLGAMTYAGLKSFLYAGVKKDDPRVVAAIGWVRRNYTLEENTGQGKAGLYYYYNTFAKAMEAWGEDPFKDAKGNLHYWRKELLTALKDRQQANGSFINKGDKTFGEADPNLATAFALLSLSYTRSPKKYRARPAALPRSAAERFGERPMPRRPVRRCSPALVFRLVIVVLAVLALTQPAQADAFDLYTNVVLAKLVESKNVKEFKQLAPRAMLDHDRVLPGITSTFLVVKTNGGRFAKLLVEPGGQKIGEKSLPLLLVNRYVTYKDGEERQVLASGKNLHLYPGFRLNLDLGQVVPEALGGDLRFVVDGERTYAEPLGKARLFVVTRALDLTPKKGGKFVMGEKVEPKHFNGTFKLFDDGRRSGKLKLEVNGDGKVSGAYYSDKDGAKYTVKGRIAHPGHVVEFSIVFPRTEQTFRGLLFTGNGKAMAGTAKLLERETAFYAIREE